MPWPGFAEEFVEIGGGAVTVRVRHGGAGAPVVLLHGHPRTLTTWHGVAPRLAGAGFTVVCPDLRGYGRSSGPPTDGRHAPYSKRAMAGDVVAVMEHLGHQRFAVVGHDRGSYVGFRLALDHPERVTRLAFLGLVPIGDAVRQAGVHFATLWWHWFFFNEPDVPERVIGADPDAWYGTGDARREAMGADNYADYLVAIRDADTRRAMLEDYRAGLGIDAEHDEADRAAARTLACPTLVLIASREREAPILYPNLDELWRAWSPDVEIAEIDTDHHMAEDAPSELAGLLGDFLAQSSPTARNMRS